MTDLARYMMNPTKDAFNEFCRKAGGRRNSGSWYVSGIGVTTVLNLQTSQYGRQHYVNVSLWLGAIVGKPPLSNRCHIGTRLERIATPSDEREIEEVFDLERSADDRQRRLTQLLERYLSPILIATKQPEWVQNPAIQQLLSRSLITRDGLRMLDELAGQIESDK
jgi:hypothetical protein